MPNVDQPDSMVLLVDDDPDFLVILQDFLPVHLGHVTIDTATSGIEALRLITRNDYDAIISDIRMPHMDGFTLMRTISEYHGETPTLLVSAHGERDLGVQALNSGAYAYLQKPIDREYLVAWVKRAIQFRRLTRDVHRHQRDLEQRADSLEKANQALRNQIEAREKCEQQLRESEERFRFLVEGVKDCALFMLDACGGVRSWNSGAQIMKGYRAEEIIGQHFSCFYTEEDLAAGTPGALLRKAAEIGRVEDEGWRVRKDGSRFRAAVVITARYDPTNQVRGYAKITRAVTVTDRARP
jgi:PAS domain S-box-containing protein